MNSRAQGMVGAGSALASVRETPNLIQICNAIDNNIAALHNQHMRINDAVTRLQNPRPSPVSEQEKTLNHQQAQTLEGRLQEINRELESLLNEATGSAVRLDEAV